MSSKRGCASSTGSGKSHISKRSKRLNMPIVKAEVPDLRFVTDSNSLLSIFPAEVWLLIFGKVGSTSVLEKVINSSHVFREQLLPQRATFLFENVWKVLGAQVEFETNKKIIANMICDLPPLISSKQVRKDAKRELLKLRLVCKSWNTGFDNFYDQHPSHFPLKKEYGNCPVIIRGIRETYHADNIEYEVNWFFKTFNAEYRTTSRNPFLGRSINIPVSQESFVFFSQLMNILLEYGHHIWYCTIYVEDSFSSRSVWYLILACVVERMPNLKVLCLEYYGASSEPTSSDEWGEVQLVVHSNPLPTLEKLQVLRTSWIPTFLFQEIVRSNGHVRTLDILPLNDSSHLCHCAYDICSKMLPNLKNFSIRFKSELEFLKTFNYQVDWSLTKLILCLSTIPFMEWQRVFSVLQIKFGDTLTHLELELPHSPTRDYFKRGQILNETVLGFPQLTYLKLCMPDLECLGFLLPPSNLRFDQNLHVGCLSYTCAAGWGLKDTEEAVSEKTKNQLFSAMRVLEFNVWIFFPKLKKYSFHFDRDPRVSFSLTLFSEGCGWCFARREWRSAVCTTEL